MGELWGVYCGYFGENWQRYSGTALYCILRDGDKCRVQIIIHVVMYPLMKDIPSSYGVSSVYFGENCCIIRRSNCSVLQKHSHVKQKMDGKKKSSVIKPEAKYNPVEMLGKSNGGNLYFKIIFIEFQHLFHINPSFWCLYNEHLSHKEPRLFFHWLWYWTNWGLNKYNLKLGSFKIM